MELMELFVEVFDLIATPTVLVALGVSALLILCRGLLRPIDRVVDTQWPDSESAMDAETARAVADYVSPVPLFGSGTEAAGHGLTDLDAPGEKASRTISKLARRQAAR